MADKVFGPHTSSQEVYGIAAKPVVKAAMEGVNGKCAFCILSSAINWTFDDLGSVFFLIDNLC